MKLDPGTALTFEFYEVQTETGAEAHVEVMVNTLDSDG